MIIKMKKMNKYLQDFKAIATQKQIEMEKILTDPY